MRARADLDHQRERADQRRALPDADPVDPGRLDRPQRRGRAPVERERNGDRREHDGEGKERAREQRKPGLAAPAQNGEQHGIEHGHRHRAHAAP